jgi:SAM-dependent methyltransferase
VRRFFDLQSGTVWRDLADELSQVRGTLLDVGCGAQPYRALVPKDAAYVGIDTGDALDVFGYHTPDTTYYDGPRWPVDDGSVDVVLATETLEHVKEPDRFLDEAYRCLRGGGRLILTVPFAARWHFIPADYWRFTPSGLLHLLGRAGFSDVVVRARGNALTVACYKAMAICTRFIMPQERSRVRSVLMRLAGVGFVPAFVAAAVVANVSLRYEGGDDCLGYTVLARKAGVS